MISLETPKRKWASSRLDRRTSWISSSCDRYSRLTTGTSGTHSGGLRKGQSRVARGPLGIPFPSILGPKTLCGVSGGTGGFLSSADMDLGVLLESRQGRQSWSRVGACTCDSLPSCSRSVDLPFSWIKGSGAFARGFPTRLSHRAVPRATVV